MKQWQRTEGFQVVLIDLIVHFQELSWEQYSTYD